MKKYQSIEAKRERIAELESLISGTEKGIRALEDYITRCDLANAEGEEWDTEDTRRLLVKTYQAREEYRNERYALIEELHDTATEAAAALCTAYEEATNSPADYLAAYHVAREEIRGIRPATAEQRAMVDDMVNAIARHERRPLDGWMETSPRSAVYLEDGYIKHGTEQGPQGMRTTYPYRRYDARTWTSEPRAALEDLKAGAVVMM